MSEVRVLSGPLKMNDIQNELFITRDFQTSLLALRLKLKDVAKRINYKPVELEWGKTPTILVTSKGKVEVVEAQVIHEGRGIFFGDSHGLIFPMLFRACSKGLLSLPITSILNVDYHADIYSYNNDTTSHVSSWQRCGVAMQFWRKEHSYNFRPYNSTAGPYPNSEKWTNEITLDEAEELFPNVLSVDLDFFMRMKQGTPEMETYLKFLQTKAQHSKIAMIFSSSMWNAVPQSTKPLQSKEQIEHIVARLNSAFTQR